MDAQEYVKKSKQCYKWEVETLEYPSVVPFVRPSGAKAWLALWIQDGLPQHCQCSAEQDGWYIINDRMGVKIDD